MYITSTGHSSDFNKSIPESNKLSGLQHKVYYVGVHTRPVMLLMLQFWHTIDNNIGCKIDSATMLMTQS